MTSVFLAWLAGQGMVFYRVWKTTGGPAMPGNLIATTALFAALALFAENPNTRLLAQATAWGFDIAAFMKLASNPPKPAQASPDTAPAPAG